MKSTIQNCLCLVLLYLMSNTGLSAQTNPRFNQIGHTLLYPDGSKAIVCSFDAINPVLINPETSASTGTNLRLGGYVNDNLSANTLYFFGKSFKNQASSLIKLPTLDASSSRKRIRFGKYRSTITPGNFTASDGRHLTRVDLSWDQVNGAEGYFIFRNELVNGQEQTSGDNRIYAVIDGGQITSWTDDQAGIVKRYRYYIAAYSYQPENIFITNLATDDGSTKGLDLLASTDEDYKVTFGWNLDAAMLLGLEQKSGEIEIYDKTDKKVVYHETIPLGEAADNLLFANSLVFDGSGNNGIWARPNLTEREPWSIELWFHAGKDGSNAHKSQKLLLADNGTFQLYLKDANANSKTTELGLKFNGADYLTAAGSVKYSEWTHVALTYDGSRLMAYINGEEKKLGANPYITTQNLTLKPDLQLGLAKPATVGFSPFIGTMGKVRIWETPRTSDQIYDDHKENYQTNVSGLLAQWTFKAGSQNLSSDFAPYKTLTIRSTNASTYPINYKPASAYIQSSTTYSDRVVYMDAPVGTGNRDFELRFYETGSGKLIDSDVQQVSFTARNQVNVVPSIDKSGAKYKVKLTITPGSKYTGKYLIEREIKTPVGYENGATTYAYVKDKSIFYKPENFKPGDNGNTSAFTIDDPYALENVNSTLAGNVYKYQVIPQYSHANYKSDYSDESKKKKTGEVTVSDYVFTATKAEGKVSLSWQHSQLSTDGYTSYEIRRDQQTFGRYQIADNVTSYDDTLVLSNKEYTYSLVALKNDAPAFEQRVTASPKSGAKIEGYLLSANEDFALPNTKLQLEKKEGENGYKVLGKAVTNAQGKFSFTDFELGLATDYRLVSVTDKKVTENLVSLTIDDRVREGLFVKYDTLLTSVKKNGIIDGRGQVNEEGDKPLGMTDGLKNQIEFLWTHFDQGLPTGDVPDLFVNVYRDGKLFDIVYSSAAEVQSWDLSNGHNKSYIDKPAKGGSHKYSIKGYLHYSSGNSQTIWDEITDTELEVPEVTTTSLVATATNEKLVSLQWSYPDDAPLEKMRVYREYNDTTQLVVEKILADETANNGNYSFSELDLRGYPGKVYNYQLIGVRSSGEEVLLDTELKKTYPDLVVPQAGFVNFVNRNANSTDRINPRGDGLSLLRHYINAAPAWTLPSRGNWDGYAIRQIDKDTKKVLLDFKLDKRNADINSAINHIAFPIQRSSANYSYDIAFYKHTDDGLFVSPYLNTGAPYDGVKTYQDLPLYPETPLAAPTISSVGNGLQAPVNFKASQDVRGQIFLSWEYPDYTDVKFKLWKRLRSSNPGAWVEIGLLPNEQRAYLHKNLEGEVYDYKLVAQRTITGQPVELSDAVGAVGKSRRYIKLEGRVLDSNQNPVPNVFVVIGELAALSDEAGFYYFEDLELANGTSEIRYSTFDNSFASNEHLAWSAGNQAQNNLIVEAGKQTYWLDVQVSNLVDHALANGNAGPAKVNGVGAFPDKSGMANVVTWKTTNEAYHGVKIYKGISEIADIKRAESNGINRFVDPVDDPNAASNVTYSVQAYRLGYSNDPIIEETGLSAASSYPTIDEPAYAHAYANTAKGNVTLIWAHLRSNVNGYIIERNGEEIAVVKGGHIKGFEDETGIPGVSYIYNIYSYVDAAGGGIFKSAHSQKATATYPLPADVLTVKAAYVFNKQNQKENKIKLSWTYPTNVSDIEGVVIKRAHKIIATLPKETTFFHDSTAVPNTQVKYTVHTAIKKDGAAYLAKGISDGIVFPRLVKPENVDFKYTDADDVKIHWDYTVSGVEAFELKVFRVEQNSETEVLSEMVPFTKAQKEAGIQSFSLPFVGGPGWSYRVEVRSVSVREGKAYKSAISSDSDTYPSLTKPTLTVNYTSGNSFAEISWPKTENSVAGYRMTILKGGAKLIDNIEVDKEQLSYQFLDVLNKNKTTGSYEVKLKSFAVSGLASTEGSKTWSMSLDDGQKSPAAFTASDDLPNGVKLTWTAPGGGGQTGFKVYRDGVQIATLNASGREYTDESTYPGIVHRYEVEALHASNPNNKVYKLADWGQKQGSGLLSVMAITNQAKPIPNIEFKAKANLGGEVKIFTATSGTDGNAYFKDLPFNASGITYTVYPSQDAEDYDVASKQETLDISLSQSGVGQFVNNKQRTISGIIANQYCQEGCARDQVSVKLYSLSTAGDKVMETELKTDQEGRFNLTIPNILSDYTQFVLEVANQAFDDAGASVDGVTYEYALPDNSYQMVSNNLEVTLSRALLESKQHHEISIKETTYHPISVEVTGPGNCDVFSGYEFLIEVREENGKFNGQFWTTNRQFNKHLPPYKYEIRVLDVDNRDAFSKAVVDYFRSVTKVKDALAEHLAFRTSDNYTVNGDSPAASLLSMRYNKRSTISVSGLAQLQLSCPSTDYYMHTEGQGGFLSKVDLQLNVQQIIQGTSCLVTTGYIIPKFSGGIVGDDYVLNENAELELTLTNQKIEYKNNAWEKLIIEAKTPNMAAPYSQRLELYHFDNKGNFMGEYNVNIIVLGNQAAPGRDVFVVPSQEYAATQMVPLYILRDPPGNKSYSFIKEGSSLNYVFEQFKERENNGGVGHVLEKEGTGFYLKTEQEATGGNSVIKVGSRGYKISFEQKISTVKSSRTSSNLEGFLDGEDADIIVGTDVIMSYGIVENLGWDWKNCAVSKTKRLEVLPNPTKSTWLYTRSQLNNTIKYYETLVKKEGKAYKIQPGVDLSFSSGESSEVLAAKIGKAIEMFKGTLKIADSRFTPPCEMCSFARGDDFYQLVLSEFPSPSTDEDAIRLKNAIQGRMSNIRSWCAANVYKATSSGNTPECKDMADLVDTWPQKVRDEYNANYRDYMVLNDFIELLANFISDHKLKKYQQTGLDLITETKNVNSGASEVDVFHDGYKKWLEAFQNRLNAAILFQPLENLTFGAGATISRGTARIFEGLDVDLKGSSSKFKSENYLGIKIAASTSTWTGVGAGTAIDELWHAKGKTAGGILYEGKRSTNFGTKVNESESLITGFSLNDGDDGDHFSVDIYNPMTDATTTSSSFFNTVGGRSSCPWEPGTIPRDMPRVRFLDDIVTGNTGKTVFTDVDPEKALMIPVGITSGNLFGENRIVELTGVIGANSKGLDITSETVRLNSYKGTFLYVKANEEYRTYIRIERPSGSPFYDFDDMAVYVRPSCPGGKFNYWEGKAIMDTVRFEVHYRKPISPVSLSSDMGEWFIKKDESSNDNQNEEETLFRLTNYEPSGETHSLKEMYIEYKRVNDATWNRMRDGNLRPVDANGNRESQNTMTRKYLWDYFKDNLTSYSEPTYYFKWDVSGLSQTQLPDGDYQIRVTVVHDNGSTEFSNVMVGKIDRNRPRVVGKPAPVDSLLSLGDDLAVSFDENIRCEDLTNSNITVAIMSDASTVLKTLTHVTEYEFTCNGGTIQLTIKDAIKSTHDGRLVKVTLTGVEDLVGNATSTSVSWNFVLDMFKRTPSYVRLDGPHDWVMNKTSHLANSAADHDKLSFTISEYDVYQKSTSITSIEVQYKEERSNGWTSIPYDNAGNTLLTATTLKTAYEALNDNSKVPSYEISWNTQGLPDGNYAVRAVLKGSGERETITESITGLIDRTAPVLMGTPEPSDTVFHKGDQVIFSFSEEIHCTGVSASVSLDPINGNAVNYTHFVGVCSGNSYRLNFDENELKKYFGATVTVTLTNVEDLVGNAFKVTGQPDGEVVYSFKVDRLGKPTSPVSIIAPTANYLINVDNPNITVRLGRYDLFELDHDLDSVEVQYRLSNSNQWIRVGGSLLTRSDLILSHQDSIAKALAWYDQANPVVDVTWNPAVNEAIYELRAVAYGSEDFPVISGSISGTIDKEKPYFTQVLAPETGNIRLGTIVDLEFTEALDEASIFLSGNSRNFTINELVVDNNHSIQEIPVATDYFRVEAEGAGIRIFFDRTFTSSYNGATMRIKGDGFTDVNGNILGAAFSEDLTVENVADPNSAAIINLRSVNLSGRMNNQGAISLQWDNPDNPDSRAYRVERSLDARSFESVGLIEEDGSDAYNLIDYANFDQQIFYRVVQLTDDEKSLPSRIIGIESALASDEMVITARVTPNPVDDLLTLRLFSQGIEEDFKVMISDAQGMVHFEADVVRDPSNRYSFRLPASVKPGVYVLTAVLNGRYATVKFMKK